VRRAGLAPEAEADLADAWFFIADGSIEAADAFVARLRNKCDWLAASPGAGRSRDDLRSGLRGFPFGDYVILYRELPPGIQVVRILHGSRDLGSVLND
jgi:toxin ParE1/3/4